MYQHQLRSGSQSRYDGTGQKHGLETLGVATNYAKIRKATW